MILRTVDKFDASILENYEWVKRPVGNQKNVHAIYKDVVCAFDIETTNDIESRNSFMYIWQFAIDTDVVIIGRCWDDFLKLCDKLGEYLPRHHKLVVYVHNLSFEFQFIKSVLNFSPRDVFAVKPRKVLTARSDIMEFRCSYLHSNMSLAQYTAKMNVRHQKLSGDEYDYSMVRYPWTPLGIREMKYAVHDVIGLVESIKKELMLEGDDLYSIPLTSTGYVRREAKAVLEKSRNHVQKIFPTLHQYKMLREAFRGGNTHANRWMANEIQYNVKCIDISSSYPSQMLYRKYPMSPFIYLGKVDKKVIDDLIYRRGKCVLMRVSLFQCSLKDDRISIPYLSYDKCYNIKDKMNIDGLEIKSVIRDNGRIIESPYLETTLTDLDYKIIKKQYNADWCFFDVYYADYGYLPKDFRDMVKEYYRQKTLLKGDKEVKYLYDKFKEKINALYGMMVQDPIKDLLLFVNTPECASTFQSEGKTEGELLAKAKKKAFLAYQWGVWVTAWARTQLQEGIDYAGIQCIYCDTDSVKYLGDIDIASLNHSMELLAYDHEAVFADRAGKKHYLGEWEVESYDYAYNGEMKKTNIMNQFLTLGAKKYTYTVGEEDEIHITIAGVNKEKGAKELTVAGGLEMLRPGFIFKEGGGTDAYYRDWPEINYIERDGRRIPITSNVYLENGEYTVSLTSEYDELLLKYLGKSVDIWENLEYNNNKE